MSQDKVERGYQAERLLANELLKECLDGMDATYHKAWRNARTVEAREDCFRYVKCIEGLLSDLQQIVLTGQLEQKRLKELEGKPRTIWANLTES